MNIILYDFVTFKHNIQDYVYDNIIFTKKNRENYY